MKAHTPAQLNTVDAVINCLVQLSLDPSYTFEQTLGIKHIHLNDAKDYCSVDTDQLTIILNVFKNAYHPDDKTNISVYPRFGTGDKTLAKNVVEHLKAGGRFVSMGPKRIIWEL
jgi:hypothetical protein